MLNKTVLSIFLIFPTFIIAQGNTITGEKSAFSGFNIGIQIGSQNIFGGADIDGLDLLTQKSGFVLEFSLGYRKSFINNNLIFGIETHYGVADGDLKGFDDRNQFDVFYKNSSQNGYGILLGKTFGAPKNYLVYTYGKVTSRTFNVEFTEMNGTTHTQEDGQKFIQYGLGIETALSKVININVSFGMISVDFGNLITSQDVEDKMDFNIGFNYKFN